MFAADDMAEAKKICPAFRPTPRLFSFYGLSIVNIDGSNLSTLVSGFILANHPFPANVLEMLAFDAELHAEVYMGLPNSLHPQNNANIYMIRGYDARICKTLNLVLKDSIPSPKRPCARSYSSVVAGRQIPSSRLVFDSTV